MVGGEPHPRTWQEYERLVIRGTEDPNVVIALRPGAWQEYARRFLRGIEDADEVFDSGAAETLDGLAGYGEAELSRPDLGRDEF